MKVLVFSKNRPLQLEAYLDSLMFYTNVKEEDIHILYRYDWCYDGLIRKYQEVRWNDETEFGFEKTLNLMVDGFDNEDVVLFGCDDCVYYNKVDLNVLSNLFYDNAIIGASFRLGTNINQFPHRYFESDDHIYYDWRYARGDFSYPFDVMASTYRVPLIKEILKTNQGKIRIPNDLESCGYYFCNQREVAAAHPLMILPYGEAKCAAMDVNRTQSLYPNRTQGTADHSIDNLIRLYGEGYRIDWQSIKDVESHEPFLGYTKWKLIKRND